MSEAVLTMPVWLPHFYNLDTFEIILISWRSDIGKKNETEDEDEDEDQDEEKYEDKDGDEDEAMQLVNPMTPRPVTQWGVELPTMARQQGKN